MAWPDDNSRIRIPRVAADASSRAARRGGRADARCAPQKRNALDDPTVAGIEAFFSALPEDIGAVVLAGDGEHFSAGLDLSELAERDVFAGIEHSRSWHRAFERIEFGKVPVVAVLHGAVVGGGLELAAAAHVRVAERSAFYALPEGKPRHLCRRRRLGAAAGADRHLARDGDDADRAHALAPRKARRSGCRIIWSRTATGSPKASSLRERIAGNAPFTNFAVMQLLPRIAAQRSGRGLRHRGARRRHRAGRRRGQGAAEGVSGKARRPRWRAADMPARRRRRLHEQNRPPLRPVKLGAGRCGGRAPQ